jgi:oligoribonuclease NrnB/cAMP/cGMP phosphodiesterase (DHH superfamily)
MNKNTYQIFTHKDLDGAVSLLTFLWSKPDSTVTYREITNIEIDLIKDYVKKTCNPPQILIMDLAIREEMYPDLDYDFITFIDHHESSENHIKKFKNAKVVYSKTSSNSLFVRKLFKDKAPEFTDAQKKLILLADDHDSAENKFKESYDLNILFWTQFRNEFCYFCEYYKNGFKPFTENQIKFIEKAKYEAKIKEENTPCFKGKLVIDGKVKDVLAATTESFNNIVLDTLMDKYDPDILFYINTKTEKVSLRQKKSEDPINLLSFAQNYCDGNGHMYAAGGKITPLFMELTKKLKPL